ncbi:MAG: TolC family protein [Saprospiraceae bacterium]|nr:TolC family protein [Saprospiraceae bacterium]
MKHNLMLKIFSCFVLLITAFLPIQAQQAFSLEEAVQYGIKNHASIKYDAIKVKDAEEQIRSLKASGLPQISGAVDYNYFLEVPQLVLPKEFDPSGMGGSVSFQLRNSWPWESIWACLLLMVLI